VQLASIPLTESFVTALRTSEDAINEVHTVVSTKTNLNVDGVKECEDVAAPLIQEIKGTLRRSKILINDSKRTAKHT
jgi:hypothetical protein